MLHKLFIDKSIQAKLKGSRAIARSKFIERETEANISTAEKMKNLKKTVSLVYDIIKSPESSEKVKEILQVAREEEKKEIDELNKSLKLGETPKKGVLERTLELIKLGMTKDEISDKIQSEGYSVFSIKKINEFIERGLSEGLISEEDINIKEVKRGRKVQERTEAELEYEIATGKPKSTMVKLDNKAVNVKNLFSSSHRGEKSII